jgi:hypothetical protein
MLEAEALAASARPEAIDRQVLALKEEVVQLIHSFLSRPESGIILVDEIQAIEIKILELEHEKAQLQALYKRAEALGEKLQGLKQAPTGLRMMPTFPRSPYHSVIYGTAGRLAFKTLTPFAQEAFRESLRLTALRLGGQTLVKRLEKILFSTRDKTSGIVQKRF